MSGPRKRGGRLAAAEAAKPEAGQGPPQVPQMPVSPRSVQRERAACGAAEQIVLETVPAPQRVPTCGRKPRGWPGGAQIVACAAALALGVALRFEVPADVPVDRVRWGIYRAAKHRGLRVSILREGNRLTVCRMDSHDAEARD